MSRHDTKEILHSDDKPNIVMVIRFNNEKGGRMSNCYDHSIKKDMMDSYYWNSKEEAKANILQNYKQLRQWYEKEVKNIKDH